MQPTFLSLTNLAAARLGAKVLYATDDFFAAKENIIQEGRGIFIPDKYTDRGKWMDGWESRRKRVAGHDWCVIQLAAAGKIEGIDIDTNHFLGNHPPFASLEATSLPMGLSITEIEPGKIQWTEILPKSPLQPGSQHFFSIPDEQIWTHLRLHIYPDGGIARLKVYGHIVKDWKSIDAKEPLDLAAAVNGARAVCCNDMFFSDMNNLLMPDRSLNMGDGWETKRSRVLNHRDWVIIQLATKGIIHKIVVDTGHFKGNYPDCCCLEGFVLDKKNIERQSVSDFWENPSIEWTPILPKMKLEADQEHSFESQILTKRAFTHVRFSIFPDGGVSRLRLFGRVEEV